MKSHRPEVLRPDAVDVEVILPEVCVLDEAALTAEIEEAYREADVAIAAAHTSTLEPVDTSYRHSVMLTGTYGGSCQQHAESLIKPDHR